jgi:predicted ABC-type ATPase
MFYVGLIDVELNIQRVAARVQQGGHHIEVEDIRRRHFRSVRKVVLHFSDGSLARLCKKVATQITAFSAMSNTL